MTEVLNLSVGTMVRRTPGATVFRIIFCISLPLFGKNEVLLSSISCFLRKVQRRASFNWRVFGIFPDFPKNTLDICALFL